MIISVWLMHKPGEPRTYTTTVCPDRQQLDSWKAQGFTVFRSNILLPIYDETEVPVVTGLAVDVNSEDGRAEGQGS